MREATVKRLGRRYGERLTRCRRWTWLSTRSVTVDRFGSDDAFGENVRLEMERNHRRYVFLRWDSGV